MYASPNIIRLIKLRRWRGACNTHGETKMHTKFWSENLKGRDRRRFEDIRLDHSEIQWEGVDCMNLDQDRDKWQAVVNTVMNLRVPQKAGKDSRQQR
jgi:hypothetical protein